MLAMAGKESEWVLGILESLSWFFSLFALTETRFTSKQFARSTPKLLALQEAAEFAKRLHGTGAMFVSSLTELGLIGLGGLWLLLNGG